MNFSSLHVDMLNSLHSALSIANISRAMKQDVQSMQGIIEMANNQPTPPKIPGEIGSTIDIKA